MSAEALGWAIRHSPYDGAAYVVHLMLADSANDQHDHEIWMRQRTIAAKARLGRQAANGALRRLVDDGYLTLLEDGKESGSINRYRFEFPIESEVIFETRRGVSPTTTPVGRTTTPPVVPDDTPEREPKENPSLSTVRQGRTTDDGPATFPTAAAIRTGTPYPDAFLAFWNGYPRKIGKTAAYKAWLARIADARKGRIPLDRRIEMMTKAAVNYAADCRGKDLEYVKHPSTFLGPAEHWKEWAVATVRPDVAASSRSDPGLIYQEV